jgi:hypothetical protein
MDSAEAQRIIEALRKGIPPDGYIRHFTVGRKEKTDKLNKLVKSAKPVTLLIKANYGTGKTHLLRYIRELALENGFSVSFITLDAKSAVQFHRMDQIFGAVIRNIEIPGYQGKGPSVLFSAVYHMFKSSIMDMDKKKMMDELSNHGKWDKTTFLTSPGLYMALRAWIMGTDYEKDHMIIPQEVEGWICEPWVYYNQSEWLFHKLISNGRLYYRDPLLVYKKVPKKIAAFNFKEYECQQAWDALRDLDTLSILLGLRGMVLLVDEFEDVINSTRRGSKYNQFDAFQNLFKLFSGRFPGYSFYAVTPDFVHVCVEIISFGYYDFDYSLFKNLPTFEMSPLRKSDLINLALRIMSFHKIAYDWVPDEKVNQKIMANIEEISSQQIPDKTRIAIRTTVHCLDDCFEEAG